MFAFLACAAKAAMPSYEAFVGSNGIIVHKFPPLGKIIIDGSGVAGGGGGSSTNGLATTNYVNDGLATKQHGSITLSNLANTGAITNVSDAANAGVSLIYTSNNFTIKLVTITAGSSVWVTNNGTNLVIAGHSTNGLASIAYVNTATNGHVTASVTNGLATISYVDGSLNFASNVLLSFIISATNTLYGQTTSDLNSASNSLVTQITTTSNGISARLDNKVDELDGVSTNLSARGLTVTVGQTNTHLTASKIVLTGPNKELISSAFGEADLATFVTSSVTNGLATISYVNDTINFSSNALVTLIVSSTNGLQRALQFNANQFTVVNGTNINISSGALVTNLAMFGNSTWGGGLSTLQSDGSLDINLMSQLFADGTANFASGGFFIAADGSASIGVGPFIQLSAGGDSTFMAGVNWFNGASSLVNDGLIFLGPLTANTLLSLDASKKTASVPNGSGILTNNGSGVFGWFPPTANALISAGSGGQLVSIPNPLAGAGQSLTFNGTNGSWQAINDGFVVQEEFIGQAGTTAGTIGREAWIGITSGNGNNVYFNDTNWGTVDFTNGATANARSGYALGASTVNNIIVTNVEIWCYFRVRCRNLNSATSTNHFQFGLIDTFTTPGNGIWVRHIQTNNIWEMCVANAGVVTTNVLITNVLADAWREFAWHLRPDQTNVVFYIGTNPKDMVPFCTNNIVLTVGALQMQIVSRRPVAATGIITTNSIDHAYLWRRNLW